VNQEFQLLGPLDLLDLLERKEKKACRVLLENLVLQGIKACLVSLVKRVNLEGLVWTVCPDSKDQKVIVV